MPSLSGESNLVWVRSIDSVQPLIADQTRGFGRRCERCVRHTSNVASCHGERCLISTDVIGRGCHVSRLYCRRVVRESWSAETQQGDIYWATADNVDLLPLARRVCCPQR